MKMNRFLKLILPLCVLFTACSSDDDQPAPLEFPELQTISVNVGEETEITFNAAGEWRLASDKSWVRFLVDRPGTSNTEQDELPIISGNKGENTVTIIMKDNGHIFSSETAMLVMTIENQTKAICEVTRPAKVRGASTMMRTGATAEFEAVERIELPFDYTNENQIGFQANFDWIITSYPEWMTPLKSITGKADQAVTANNAESFFLNNAARPYEKTGEIVISSRTGEGDSFTFPIEYAGMNPTTLIVESSDRNGITFTHDGFYCLRGGGGVTPTERRETSFDVVMRDMEYKLNLVRYMPYNPRELLFEDSWISCVDDGEGNLTISLTEDNEEEKDRTLYLYIKPPAYIEWYNYSQDFDIMGYDPSYQPIVEFNSKIGIPIIQQGKKGAPKGFRLLYWGWDRMDDPELVDDVELQNLYNTENIFVFDISKDKADRDLWDDPTSMPQRPIRVEVDGLEEMEAVKGELENYTNWVAKLEPGQGLGYFNLENRVPYDELPNTPGHIIVRNQQGDIHGVLILSKDGSIK